MCPAVPVITDFIVNYGIAKYNTPRADSQTMTKRSQSHFALLFAVILLSGTDVRTQNKHTHASLGTVNFPVSCSQPAQAEFNRAVALLHHMTYPQSRETFQRVTASYSDCAMAHWGVAMTLFQPLWPTRPSPAALKQGWDEVQQAKKSKLTAREQMFVDAAEAFFLDPSSTDYWLRIRRWEQAMERVYAAFPGDSEAAAFYALAHL